jgi:hypothetical protein
MEKRIVKENEHTGEVHKYQCVECDRLTNSAVLYSTRFDGSEEIGRGIEISWYDDYRLIRCLGCDSISLVKKSWFSEDWDPIDNGITYSYYPSFKKKVALENDDIPEKIAMIYKESIDAYNSGAYILVAAGLRAVIEAICSSKKIDRGTVPYKNGGKNTSKNLEGKIHGLMDEGYVSPRQLEALHELRFLGNTALHEIDKPTELQINIAFSIIESIIEVIYGFEDKSKKLRDFREKH